MANKDNVVDLAAYRERRIKEGTWPPDDRTQYWLGRMEVVLGRRASLTNPLAGTKVGEMIAPKETLPPVDPKTGKPNFTKEELAEYDDLFPEDS